MQKHNRLPDLMNNLFISPMSHYLLQTVAPHHSIFRSSPGDVLIDLLLEVVSVRPSVHKKFFPISLQFGVRVDLDRMCTSVTSTQFKVKVMGLLKFLKLQFSRSISSAILAWSSKVMVDHDSMGPSLQLVRA